MARLSNYVIDTEITDENQNMLVHGYTGAIDIIDRELANYLKNNKDSLERGTFPFGEENYDLLNKRGYITDKTPVEEVQYVKDLANLLHKKNLNGIKCFGFIITYNCNFRCPYCYESRISNFGKNWSQKTFTKEIVDEAYEALATIEPVKEKRYRGLLLYGGEPLLKKNQEVVKYIVNKGVGLGYRFGAISNGFELENYEDILGPDKLGALQITIDGPRDQHNTTRVHQDGFPTFDKILSNVEMALNKECKVSIRMNTNMENIDKISALHDFFEKKGFYKNPLFQLNSALIYDYLDDLKESDDKAKGINYMSHKDYIDVYEKHPDFNFEDEGFYKRISDSITKGQRMMLQPTYCGAPSNSYLLDPYHNIYACWERIGDGSQVVGKYNKDRVKFFPNLEEIHSHNVSEKETCSKCKFVFLCRGGCPVKAKTHNCKLVRELFKTSVNKVYKKNKKYFE